jgi:2,4-dienoyl-CoA reductase-like NADH-dependent reductase (Old Yellow Enzyme family)
VSTPRLTLTRVWTPLTIGTTTVKHRIMVTGHTQLYGKEEIVSDRHIAYYQERARGGAALLVLEQQAVHPSGMNYHAGCIAWERRVIPQYEKLAEAVHQFGCRQFVQLFACGAQGRGTMYIDRWRPLWAASRVPSVVYNETPMVTEQEQIDEILKGFGESAVNAQLAGIDGVEVHAAHSQLLGEFLSPAFNKRTDRYGGSVRNRCRLVIEIGETIRKRVGSEFTLGLRLSFDEFLGPAGITPEQAEEQLDIFAAAGLFNFFNISGGGYHTLHIAVAPMGSVPEGFMAPFGKRAKQIVGDRAKVFIAGRIVDVHMAEQILTDGAADMVAMTRAHMADPFIVNKTREGREEEITRCVGANVCVSRLIDNVEVTCVMNPVMGRERQWGEGSLKRVAQGGAKKIAVVGGGPAGLKFAAVAAKRGHKVTVYEQAGELGGHLNLLKRLPTRAGWQGAIDNLARPLERAGVEVRLRTVATKELLATETPDAVVCATGASYDRTGYSPYRVDRETIPGVEQSHVLEVAAATRKALLDAGSLGGNVLILDETDGYLPLGLAEVLANAGVRVEVVTPHLFVGEDTLKTLEMAHLFPRLRAVGVRLSAQQFVESIDGRRVEIYDIWGGERRTIEMDTVVLAMMRSPNDELFSQLRGIFKEVHRIGDVVAPRKLEAVIYEGEKLGREI